MTMIAYGVAQRFQKFPALEAYRLDIIGSLSGIVAYSLLAYFRVPPRRLDARDRGPDRRCSPGGRERSISSRPRSSSLIAVVGTAQRPDDLVAVLPRAVLRGRSARSASTASRTRAMIDIARARSTRSRTSVVATPAKDVLIVGAGNGNDVAAALAAGAEHVDAVEIDPQICRTSAPTYHPDRPVRRPARHANRERRPRVPAADRQEVRPHHLRAAGLAHPRERTVGGPTRELPVHEGGDGGRPRPSEPRRRLLDVQLLSRAVAPGSAGRRAATTSTATRRAST